MDDLQINQLAKSLEAEIAESEMKLQIKSCEKPSICFIVTANRAGCLELARMFLTAAIKPIESDDCLSKPVILSDPDMQVFSSESKTDLLLAGIQRMEQWPESDAAIHQRNFKPRLRDRIALLGCAAFALGLIFLLIGGVGFWWMIFTGEIR